MVVGTIQSALFLLIFRYVFGGAIATGGLDYVDFLVPGFITTGVLFAGMGAAAGVAEDLEQGFVDRPRSLPIPRARSWPAAPWPTPPCWSGAWPSPRPSASRSGSGSTAAWPTPWPPSACCWWTRSGRSLTQGPAAEAMLGHDASWHVTRSLLWSAAILAVFVPLAVARYRRG